MPTLLKRLHAIGFMAVSWAVAWAPMGALFRVVWPVEAGLGVPTWGMILGSGLGWMYPGAMSGAVFALLLVARAPRRIEVISVRRMILLGTVGGALLPTLFAAAGAFVSSNHYSWVLPLLPKYVIAGGLCGAVSLLLARRGPPADEQTAFPRERPMSATPLQSASDRVVRIHTAHQLARNACSGG